MVSSAPSTNGDDDFLRQTLGATAGPVSLGSLLESVQRGLLHGEPPLEFRVANEPWGTLAFRPGDVMAIAAPPGMGKSALLSQLIDDAHRLNPRAISLTVNVEMTPQIMIERKISRLSGVPLADITRRNHFRYQACDIQPAMATLVSIGDRMFFMGSPFTLEHIVEAVQQVEPNILVIDYLQRIECCMGVSDTRARMNTLMHAARNLATAGICVVLVSAVARTQSKKGGGYNANEIGMGSFRESSEIEYGSDDAFVLVEEERTAVSLDEPFPPRVLNLKHVKSRNNQRHDLRLEFDGSVQQFRLLPSRSQAAGAELAPVPPSSVRPPRRNLVTDPWLLNFPGGDEQAT